VAGNSGRKGPSLPHVGSPTAWTSEPCATWPARDRDRYTGPFNRRISAPILIVGTRYDPATPYENAQAVAGQLPRSRLLTLDGWGHVALDKSSCIASHVDRYLVPAPCHRPEPRVGPTKPHSVNTSHVGNSPHAVRDRRFAAQARPFVHSGRSGRVARLPRRGPPAMPHRDDYPIVFEPSMASRMMSAWPACCEVSAMMCSSTRRTDQRAPGSNHGAEGSG
jgi:hypothetical protein